MFRTGQIKLNPQINLPFNFLIQKYLFQDSVTFAQNRSISGLSHNLIVSENLRTLPVLSSFIVIIERICSDFCVSYTKLCNRLGLEKTDKLLSCYRELCSATDSVIIIN